MIHMVNPTDISSLSRRLKQGARRAELAGHDRLAFDLRAASSYLAAYAQVLKRDNEPKQTGEGE
jgi:hypothetical protein